MCVISEVRWEREDVEECKEGESAEEEWRERDEEDVRISCVCITFSTRTLYVCSWNACSDG